jgi:LacI family transcriptional regulator
MAKLTLEEIGQLAGVSRSTVSRVINHHPNVSTKVRKKVERVIKDTGFSPNLAARTLVSQRSYVVGLVIPRSIQTFFGDPYFARLTQGIAQAANLYDYTFSLFLLESREIEERLLPRITRPGFIDGLIIQATAADDYALDSVVNGSIPYVIAGTPIGYNNVTYIDVDNIYGASLAVEHLIKLGRRRIATVTGPLSGSPGRDRRLGYEQTLAKHCLPFDERLVVESDFSEEGAYRAAKQILKYDPDAIFIASDQMAIGALRAIKDKKLKVPKDISVVGFDDLPPARYADPQLTTIRQPILRFGIAAFELLLKYMVDNSLPSQKTLIDVELVVRDSCGGKK